MPVRTKQLVLVTLTQVVPGAGTNIYTAPAGETVIVKSIYVWNNAPAAAVPDMAVRTAGGNSYPFNRDSVAAGAVLRIDPMWVVLMPGDSIRTNPSIAGQFRYAISGAELEGVAD